MPRQRTPASRYRWAEATSRSGCALLLLVALLTPTSDALALSNDAPPDPSIPRYGAASPEPPTMRVGTAINPQSAVLFVSLANIARARKDVPPLLIDTDLVVAVGDAHGTETIDNKGRRSAPIQSNPRGPMPVNSAVRRRRWSNSSMRSSRAEIIERSFSTLTSPGSVSSCSSTTTARPCRSF